MKTSVRFSRLLPVAAALVLAAVPARADLFGRGAKGRLFDKADAEWQAAGEAARDGRVVDQIASLKNARASYLQLATEHPDYESKTVRDRLRQVEFTLAGLNEKMERGEIVVTDGEAASQEAAGGPAALSIDLKKPTDPAPPDFRRPIPALVRTAPGAVSEPDAAPGPAAGKTAGGDPLWMRESIPNPLFSGTDPVPADPVPAVPTPAAVPAPSVRESAVRRTFDPAAAVPAREPAPAPLPAARPEPAPLPAEDAVLLSRIESMIRERRAGEAVVTLEDLIEAEGDAASLRARILFVRALVGCGNYDRAADELSAAVRLAPSDPSVRSLAAAVAVARGDAMAAQRQLDRLVSEHRDWSDVYVDFAYVTFLSGPTDPAVRKLAVSYYKTGLERGAARDRRLEEELDVRVE